MAPGGQELPIDPGYLASALRRAEGVVAAHQERLDELAAEAAALSKGSGRKGRTARRLAEAQASMEDRQSRVEAARERHQALESLVGALLAPLGEAEGGPAGPVAAPEASVVRGAYSEFFDRGGS